MHGWQDNCGTFDTLAPLLPSHVSFLALDLPGHGLSSRMPDGIPYSNLNNVMFLKMIQKEYNWDKISLIGHSMGSNIGFLFTGIYPDDVDMMIGIDALRPGYVAPERTIEILSKSIDGFMIADERNQDKSEPPSYTYDELIERLYNGTSGSVTKETCPFLLERAIKKSEKYPEKYYFSRDSRLKYTNIQAAGQEALLNLARKITSPYLYIQAELTPLHEEEKYFNEGLAAMKENPNFQHQLILNATHHLHLTNPCECE